MCISPLFEGKRHTISKKKKVSKMVSLSVSSSMLVLVMFIFLTLKDTIAHSGQARKSFVVHEAENGVEVALRSRDLSVEKEVLDGVPTAAILTNDKIGGRKMMIERRNMKKNMKLQAESIKTEEKSMNSGPTATHSVGNFNHKRQGKLRVLSSKLSGRSTRDSMKVNTGGFMALNADYHMARPHPPKNN